MSRDHEEARLAAGRAALRRFREAQLQPGAVIPTYVEREFSVHARWRPGPRPLGPRRRRCATERRDRAGRGRAGTAATDRPSADVVSPTLGILGPERVTITDYKSSDVRDPAKARQRARESLQLQIYAMGYEAMTGRLPDAIALHFLESGSSARSRSTRSGWPRRASGSPRPRPGCGRATTRRSPTTSPAPTARSATSARRASRAERPIAASIPTRSNRASPQSTRPIAAHRSRPGASARAWSTGRSRSTDAIARPADPTVGASTGRRA